MPSGSAGTKGGRCSSSTLSTVLLDLAVVMLPKLAADRSNKLDHLAADSLYHFSSQQIAERFQGQGPGVRRGSGVAEDQRGGPVPARLLPVAVCMQSVQA